MNTVSIASLEPGNRKWPAAPFATGHRKEPHASGWHVLDTGIGIYTKFSVQEELETWSWTLTFALWHCKENWNLGEGKQQHGAFTGTYSLEAVESV